MTAQERFAQWDAVLAEIQQLNMITLIHKFAIKGVVANSGQDAAYLKRVISQKYPNRKSFNTEELIMFKQQIQYCRKCKQVYAQSTYLLGNIDA